MEQFKTEYETGPTVLVQPKEVYFRSPLGAGVSVVVVSFTRSVPHVLSYYENREGRTPLSQSIEDMLSYVGEARKRIGL